MTGLTGAAFSPAGVPMLAATCARPGVAGLFAETNGTWHATGPRLPAAFSKENIDVVRLAATGSGMVALLRAGTGTLLAGWMASSGGAWTLSPPLRTGGRRVTSTAVGPGSSMGIILNAAERADLVGPGRVVARAAGAAQVVGDPRTRVLGPGGRARGPRRHVHGLAPGARGLGQRPDHPRDDPLRVIELSPP